MKSRRVVRINVGSDSVTLTEGGAVTVANILGAEREGRSERIYLDRLVHEPHESEIDEWRVSGAISSILERTRDH